MHADIWVLQDDRTGNTSQAIALAEALGLQYKVQNIEYNFCGKLPNFFLQFKPLHVKGVIVQSLLTADFPQIIISAGRRTSLLALYLKKKSHDKIKTIQINNPNSNLKDFDFIILGQHDKIQPNNFNIIRVIGALSNPACKINLQGKELGKYYPQAKDFIGVIIGGNTKNYKFSELATKELMTILKNIAANHTLPLFFSFSRRTPHMLKAAITGNFSQPHIIYDPQDNMPNPYFGILRQAKYIICTADSISMCSEIASSGKPLYIYCPDDFVLKKHRFFIQQLLDIKAARQLSTDLNLLEDYYYVPLNEVIRVADIIKQAL